MTPVVLPWLVEIGLITWRSLTGIHFVTGKTLDPNKPYAVLNQENTGVKRPPLPSELLASFVIFGTYAIIAEKDARIGQLLAWGTVLATGLLMFGGKTPSLGQQQEQLNPRQNTNILTGAGAVGAATPQNPNPYSLYYPYPQAQTGQGGF